MKAVGAVLLAAVALAAMWSWSKTLARQEAEQALVQAEAALTRGETAKRVVQKAYDKYEQQRAQLSRAAAAAPATRVAAAEPEAVKGPSAEARALAKALSEERTKQEDPQVQLKSLARRRANIDETYAAFYRLAGWSPERVRAFEDIYMMREEGIADLQAVAIDRGSSLNDPEFQKLSGALYQEYEKSARGLLGNEGYTQLVNYERTADVRELVSSVAGAALVEGLPLSARQMERLVVALAETSESYRKGDAAIGIHLDWAAVEALLPGILTEQQLAFVRTMEAPGGGVFHTRWNAELVKATAAEKKQRSAGK